MVHGRKAAERKKQRRGGEKGGREGACASSVRSSRDPGRRTGCFLQDWCRTVRTLVLLLQLRLGREVGVRGRRGKSLRDVSMEFRLSFRRRACACRRRFGHFH